MHHYETLSELFSFSPTIFQAFPYSFFFGSNLFSVAIIGFHEIVSIEVVNFTVPPQSSMSCLRICELSFALCLKCDNQPLLPMTSMISGLWLIQPPSDISAGFKYDSFFCSFKTTKNQQKKIEQQKTSKKIAWLRHQCQVACPGGRRLST